MVSPTGAASRVVVHFLDGRLLKGTTRDFFPNKQVFHVYPEGAENAAAEEIGLSELKAVFFVRTFEGDPDRHRDNSFENARGQGRRILVTFKDGETIAGFTMGYAPGRSGFFMIPADAESNNMRIYVVTSAVTTVRWAAAAREPEPVGA